MRIAPDDLFLQLKPTHVRHSHIGNNTAGFRHAVGEKFPGGAIEVGVESGALKQKLKRVADFRVVIHNEYVLLFYHATSWHNGDAPAWIPRCETVSRGQDAPLRESRNNTPNSGPKPNFPLCQTGIGAELGDGRSEPQAEW